MLPRSRLHDRMFNHESIKSILSWAFFVGTSWTWCIGMFLPALISNEFGFAGWLAFAIPNISGGILMAWMISSPDASIRFVTKYRTACALFSWVTIAFHAFFIAWVVGCLLGVGGRVIALVLSFLIYFLIVKGVEKYVSVVVWFFSTIILVFFFTTAPVVFFPPAVFDLWDLAGVFCVSVFGFLTCPFFDLTFHRAIQKSPVRSVVVFFTGFFLVFLPMILATYLYAPYIYSLLLIKPIGVTFMMVLLAAHFIVQSAQTVAYHFRELQNFPERYKVLFVAFCVVLVLVNIPNVDLQGALKISFHELVYRSFLVFYGLVFPSYFFNKILVESDCDGSCEWGLSKMVEFAVFFVFSFPFYWLGFINKNYMLLPLGVIISIVPSLIRFVRQL